MRCNSQPSWVIHFPAMEQPGWLVCSMQCFLEIILGELMGWIPLLSFTLFKFSYFCLGLSVSWSVCIHSHVWKEARGAYWVASFDTSHHFFHTGTFSKPGARFRSQQTQENLLFLSPWVRGPKPYPAFYMDAGVSYLSSHPCTGKVVSQPYLFIMHSTQVQA